MELLPTDQPKDSGSDPSNSSEDEIFSLPHCASVGVQGKKTIKLHALVNNQELLVLIDSGSSSTIISDKAAHSLHCSISKAPPVQVTVANGDKI